MSEEIYPFSIYLLSKDDNISSFLKSDIEVSFSRFMNQPQMQYGFTHWIHKIKDNTYIFNDPRFKKKYLVANPFEHQTDNNDKDIKTLTGIYFDIKSNNIISRAFYKLWEILMIYSLFPTKGPIISVHLAEAPGAFVQATKLYRNKLSPDAKKDKLYCISIKSDDKDGITFKDNILSALGNVHVCDIEDGDITKPKVQIELQKLTGEAEFITADGGFMWKNENYQEQEAYRLLLGEMTSALRLQKRGGCFVMKIFETFTDISVKFLTILNNYYDKVYIHKPFTSRLSNSERYVICIGFKGISTKELNNLEKALKIINDREMKGEYLADIIPKYNIPNNIKMINRTISLNLMNKQFISINKALSYINGGNYFGEVYRKYLDEQKNAAKFWSKTFLPEDIKSSKNTFENIINQILEDNDKEIKKLEKAIEETI